MEPITSISAERLKRLYPPIQLKAKKILEEAYLVFGHPLNMVGEMRTMQEQADIFAQGRKLVNGKWMIEFPYKVVTNSNAGESYHNYGLAFDCAFTGKDPYLYKLTPSERERHWRMYGDIVEKSGMVWGGNFKIKSGARDLPHAELSYGLTLHQLYDYYHKTKSIEGVWNILDKIGHENAQHIESDC